MGRSFFIHAVFPQLPVRSCAAVMASIPGGAVSATVAGRALSVTFLPPNVSILNAVDMDCVWRATVCATLATKEPTVSKVNEEKKRFFPLDWKQLNLGESTQFIGETIGVFNSTEQIMLWMLLLILCV